MTGTAPIATAARPSSAAGASRGQQRGHERETAVDFGAQLAAALDETSALGPAPSDRARTGTVGHERVDHQDHAADRALERRVERRDPSSDTSGDSDVPSTDDPAPGRTSASPRARRAGEPDERAADEARASAPPPFVVIAPPTVEAPVEVTVAMAVPGTDPVVDPVALGTTGAALPDAPTNDPLDGTTIDGSAIDTVSSAVVPSAEVAESLGDLALHAIGVDPGTSPAADAEAGAVTPLPTSAATPAATPAATAAADLSAAQEITVPNESSASAGDTAAGAEEASSEVAAIDTASSGSQHMGGHEGSTADGSSQPDIPSIPSTPGFSSDAAPADPVGMGEAEIDVLQGGDSSAGAVDSGSPTPTGTGITGSTTSRDTARTAATRAADAAADPQSANGADPTRRAQLVDLPGVSRMEIDLADEGLGPLRLQAIANGNTLHLQLTSSDASVRDLIARNAAELRQDITSAGLELGSLDVGTSPHGGAGRDAGSGTAADRSADRPVERRTGRSDTAGTPSPAALSTRSATAERALDLRL